ncbi:MAG: polyphenol oxidase family protein [Leptospiraceae bacterium]|nr:polyphenol oxidase family protein [Leptospiraceae bacterium]MCP5512458.1 polyphenol oxidase family protein [Leptospiraceae bacterium]
MIFQNFQSGSYYGEFGVLGRSEVPDELFSGGNSYLKIKKFLSLLFRLPPESVILLNQVHGSVVFRVPAEISEEANGDGIFTTSPNYLLVIKTADCMPIYFWSESKPFIALLHSGWRGTHRQITEQFLSRIQSEIDRKELRSFLGPCIRQEDYEVDEFVINHFLEYPTACTEGVREGKFQLGLEKVLDSILKKEGVKLDDCGISVFQDERYYSHRKGDQGRNLNYILLRPSPGST